MKRNRIIYLILCIIAVILASFYGGPISYSILFGLILVIPVSLIYLFTVYHFFKLYQVIGSKKVTVYEPVPYYFVLQNEYPVNFCRIGIKMYSTFSYIDDEKIGKEGAEYELLPGENIRYDSTLICRYRGDYRIGIEAITITDFLRLFKITYSVPEPLNAEISPRIVKIAEPKSIPQISVMAHQENPRLNTDFDAAVREYEPNDPLKGIHWKLSAREGKLKSRLTYGEQKRGISVFLDTGRYSKKDTEFIPAENKALEIVLSLTDYFTSFSVPVTFFYSQQEPVSTYCSASYEMESFLSEVSGIRFRPGASSAGDIRILTEKGSFSNSQIVFLILTAIDAEINKQLFALSRFGVRVVVYYVSSHPDMENILEMQNVNVVTIHPDDKIEEVL